MKNEEFEKWADENLMYGGDRWAAFQGYQMRQPEIDALKSEVLIEVNLNLDANKEIIRLELENAALKTEEGMPYGIIDPDYARIYSKVRCTAWTYGYAAMMHGSFTRDLDLLLVPWTDSVSPALEQKHLINMICDRCGLRENGHHPSVKPHGRTVYTLMFQTFGDPRFIDVGFMPAAIDAAMKETK